MSLSVPESMVRAASLAIAGKKEEALAELCRACSEGRQSAKLYSAIGHLQFELRHFQAAAGAYQEALRLDGVDSATHYNRGVCLEKLQAWEEAAAAFQRAIDLDSRRTSSYLGLGISQLHLERPLEALSASRNAWSGSRFARPPCAGKRLRCTCSTGARRLPKSTRSC